MLIHTFRFRSCVLLRAWAYLRGLTGFNPHPSYCAPVIKSLKCIKYAQVQWKTHQNTENLSKSVSVISGYVYHYIHGRLKRAVH